MKISMTARRYGVLFLGVGCLLISLTTSRVLAYSTTQINALLEDGTATAVGFDNGYCRKNLLDNIGINDANSLRASFNGDGAYKQASYRDSTWLSDRGKPNTNNPVSVGWGDTTVPL